MPESILTTRPQRAFVLGTALEITTYAKLIDFCCSRVKLAGATVIDFSNTHTVTMRRHDKDFHSASDCVDYFIPDGMPLVWCLNRQGAGLSDRVYGPTFMRRCVLATPAPLTHYFLGGWPESWTQLRNSFLTMLPSTQIVGSYHSCLSWQEESSIVEEINRLSPDFVWVGLGAPKQYHWISRLKSKLNRGVILAVGFAFDVNAGTKKDAPFWMQRRGLTWLFRMASEPRRLGPRYLRYNSLFLFYLFWDVIRGRAGSPRSTVF